MDFGKIFTQAALLVWRQRAMWLFGFFTVLIGYALAFLVSLNSVLTSTTSRASDAGILALALTCALCFVSIVCFVLYLVSETALIGMVNEIAASGATTMSHGWRIGGSYALRNFGISFTLVSSVLVVLLFVICVPIFLLVSVGGQSRDAAAGLFSVLLLLYLVGMFCVAAIVGMILQLIVILAYRASVLENLGVIASIHRALYLIRSYLGAVLLIGSSLLSLRAAFLVVIYIIQFIVTFAFMLLMLGSGPNSAISSSSSLAAVCFGLFVLLPVVCADGLLNIFNSATWTLAYRAWRAQELPSLS
jgi:hypothetical protein